MCQERKGLLLHMLVVVHISAQVGQHSFLASYHFVSCLSLQTDDGGESGNRGMSEHDKDCGRQFIPDDTVQPLYAGFQDYIEIPQVCVFMIQ